MAVTAERGYQSQHTGREMLLGVFYEGDVKPGGTRTQPAFSAGEGHRLVIGPTGSGKFWAVIAPLLLTADESSAIVFDVAGGEAALNTARHRGSLGDLLILDPYRLASDGSGALNPIDFLGADDGGMLARARALADAIMMEAPSSSDGEYFHGQALDLLSALLIHVHTWPLETDRTLGRVRDLIRGPIEDQKDKNTGEILVDGMGLEAMAANSACDNFVRDVAYNATEDRNLTGGRNFFFTRQTLRQNTSFLDAPEVRRVTSTTTLNVRLLREGVATLYVVTPSAEMRALGRWMRLIYATIIPRLQQPVDAARHSARTGVPLHIVMDEFAAFGPFLRVTDDMATVRKFGITYTVAIQKLSQLQGLYSKSWETFVPRYLQILGSDEQATSEYVSKRMGTERKDQVSRSTSRGEMGKPGSSESTSQYTKPFREPHEIGGMSHRHSYVLVQGSPKPLYLRKAYAFEDAGLSDRLGGFEPIHALPRYDAGTLNDYPSPSHWPQHRI